MGWYAPTNSMYLPRAVIFVVMARSGKVIRSQMCGVHEKGILTYGFVPEST